MRMTCWRGRRTVSVTALAGLSTLVVALASLPVGATAGTHTAASALYRCTTSSATLDFPVSISGSTPKIVAPRTNVVIHDLQATITIPAAAVNLLALTSGPNATVTGRASTVD